MVRKSFKFEVLGHEIELHAYLEENAKGKDSVLIFPGGGYEMLSVDREGVAVANAYFERGLNAFVLHYAVGREYKYPSHLTDASFAITYIKAHADEFGIDPARIFTVGFSAGGHLSGSMAILHKDPEVLSYLDIAKGDNKPCGSILAYPVVSANVDTHKGSFERLAGKTFAELTEAERHKLSLEDNVDEDSAPIFIWHTSEDPGVPMLGSIRLTEAYYSIGRAVSLHVYPYGPHGIALANDATSCGNPDWVQPLAKGWVDESVRWIKAVKSY
jgi:acetyl esterase/lipase